MLWVAVRGQSEPSGDMLLAAVREQCEPRVDTVCCGQQKEKNFSLYM